MKEKKILTSEDLLKRAKNYKKESPEEFEQKLKEFEALHGNKFKVIAEQIALPSIGLNNLAKNINRTQLIIKSFKSPIFAIPQFKASLPSLKIASSLIETTNALKLSFNIFPQIDWDKVNAYALIDELEKEGINPKVIKDIDLEQLSELIKEAKKIKSSLAKIIKDSSDFEEKLSYEVLLGIITEIKTEIKNLKRKEMVLRIAQDYLNNSQNILIPESLTPREKDVFIQLMMAKSNKLIAKELNISESTTEKHINSILKKTGCLDSKELLVRCRR